MSLLVNIYENQGRGKIPFNIQQVLLLIPDNTILTNRILTSVSYVVTNHQHLFTISNLGKYRDIFSSDVNIECMRLLFQESHPSGYDITSNLLCICLSRLCIIAFVYDSCFPPQSRGQDCISEFAYVATRSISIWSNWQ